MFCKFHKVRRDRSDFWEGIKAHNATVTCAIFAPHPEAIIKPEIDNEMSDKVQVEIIFLMLFYVNSLKILVFQQLTAC